MQWSYIRSLADSKIVRSSYIWLFIVPLGAKALSTLDEIIDLTMFDETISLATTLPFSWQVLFFSACAFTIANLIYALFCPDIFKTYRSYTEFKEDGKTLLQIHSAMKKMLWSNKKPGVKSSYVKELSSYFDHYCAQQKMDEKDLDLKGRELFNDTSQAKYITLTGNAFYFSHTIADKYNQSAIWAALMFYGIGLLLVGVIAIQNISYVLSTYG